MKISPAIRLPSPLLDTIEPDGHLSGNKSANSNGKLRHFSMLGNGTTLRGAPARSMRERITEAWM